MANASIEGQEGSQGVWKWTRNLKIREREQPPLGSTAGKEEIALLCQAIKAFQQVERVK